MESTEKTFYQDNDVVVTQSRFMAQTKTYAMRNISSVSIYHHKKSRILPIALLAIGILTLINSGTTPTALAITAVAIIWLLILKDNYVVRINSNAGETDGFRSHDRQRIEKIVSAVNDAIIFRG